jgi:hypothetical protein
VKLRPGGGVTPAPDANVIEQLKNITRTNASVVRRQESIFAEYDDNMNFMQPPEGQKTLYEKTGLFENISLIWFFQEVKRRL